MSFPGPWRQVGKIGLLSVAAGVPVDDDREHRAVALATHQRDTHGHAVRLVDLAAVFGPHLAGSDVSDHRPTVEQRGRSAGIEAGAREGSRLAVTIRVPRVR